MARPECTKSPVKSVPIFPPSLHAPCKVEQTREHAARIFQAAMENPPAAKHTHEEEEPERWDGMS